MFDTWSPGFTIVQLMAQVTALLGNTVVIGLVAGSIALSFAPRLLHFIKGVLARR